MKRYFPQEDNYLPVLLPYHYKLKPQMIHAMCAAPNAEAVLELAQQTPYGRIFDQHSGEDLNYLYTATIYRTSRRQLMMGKPSIYSAVALMNLREIELKAGGGGGKIPDGPESVHTGHDGPLRREYMSVQAMKFVTVTGPLPEFEAVVRQCVVDRPFHPESVLQVMHRNNHLRSLNMPNQVMPLLRQAEEVLTRLELEPEYRPFAEGADLAEGQRYLDDLTQQLDQMDQWEEALKQETADDRSSVSQLELRAPA